MEQEQFQERIRELATEAEDQPAVQVDVELPENGTRTVSWALALASALFVAAFGAAAVFMAPRFASLSTTDQVAALVGDNACAVGMAVVVDAITAYARDHGGPPPRLSDLSPAYLPEPPLDPVSSKPYEYTPSGSSVALSCPAPDSPAAALSGPGAQPG